MKMILVMTAKSGKTREAVAALKAGNEYVSSKYGTKGEVYMQIMGGTAGTFYIIGDYPDLASIQTFQAKIMADDKYWERVQTLVDVMIDPPTVTLLQPI